MSQGPLVWDLVRQGGFIYVCGAQVMRDDVRSAFVSVFAQYGAMTPEAAEAYMVQMATTENRYRPDVWG